MSRLITLSTVQPAVPATPQAARWLALGAVAGPVLFELTWLILGPLSPGYTLSDHRFTDYSVMSQSISGLGMGPTAPWMNAAFIASGLLLTAGAIGVMQTTIAAGRPTARWTCAVLLGLSGVGQMMDGMFNLEAVLLHSVGFLLALGAPVVSFLVTGLYFRRIPRWRRFGTWLLSGSPLTLVLLVFYFITFEPTVDGAEHGIAGLVQRAGVVEAHAWFVAMGWLAFRRS
jgi:hypothetical membrane protein